MRTASHMGKSLTFALFNIGLFHQIQDDLPCNAELLDELPSSPTRNLFTRQAILGRPLKQPLAALQIEGGLWSYPTCRV